MNANEIRDLRRRLGVTQETLAKLLNVTVWTVNRWEAGRVSPRGARLRALQRLEKH